MNRTRDAFRFRIELAGIEPPIWREIVVPARYSFWDLHVAIQDSMGWLDYHLHEFHVPVGGGEEEDVFGIPMEDDGELPYTVLPGWHASIADAISEPGTRFKYEYDFGDSWTHTIELLAIETREKGMKYPRCTGGERGCPPEDCGGIYGYEELLRVLFSPDDPEHEEMKEWVPAGWGPEVFDPKSVRFDNPTRRWRQAFGG